ncbi:unnamed protein product [Urochloa humidicola]
MAHVVVVTVAWHTLLPYPPLSLTTSAATSNLLARVRWLVRLMSSYDAHLIREKVVNRFVDVLKSHPKVDHSKVTPTEGDLGLDSLDHYRGCDSH